MKKAVCDTSALIRLKRGKALNCLTQLFDKLYIPMAVKDECLDVTLSKIILNPPFQIHDVHQVLDLEIDLGELEAVSLAIELNIKHVIIDDDAGFRVALQRNLLPVSSGRILVAAKKLSIIHAVKPILNTMKTNGECFSNKSYLKILEEAGEI
ncbi:MAG: hypothetical protein HQK57_06445 [Deltaproteobacteria bacterium]|nr:hypothetical protein [Deltaproteobacteria bacterium]